MEEEVIEEIEQEEDLSIKEDDKQEEVFTPSSSIYYDQIVTHKKLPSAYAGRVIFLEKNHAKTSFTAINEMSIDELGLIHSGFILGAADYAACLAVNNPNTVVIGSKVSFLAPAKVDDVIEFEAILKFEDLRKREVDVVGKINNIKIFKGIFHIVVLEKHIFQTKIKGVKRQYEL